MRDDIFKQKLNEVAECYVDKDYNIDYELRKKIKRGTVQSNEMDQIDGAHRTYPLTVKQLKIQGCHCEDCGNWCENGRKTEKKLYKTGKTHWRTRCVTCRRWQHPDSGEFTLTPATSAVYYNQWVQRQIKLGKNTEE